MQGPGQEDRQGVVCEPAASNITVVLSLQALALNPNAGEGPKEGKGRKKANVALKEEKAPGMDSLNAQESLAP